MTETNSTETKTRCHPRMCGGRGKRFFFGALGICVLSVLTAGALRAFGHGPLSRSCHGSMSSEDMEKHVDRMTQWVMDDLKGTPEQRQKAAEIAKAAVKDLAPVRAEIQTNHHQAIELLSQPTIDRAAIETVRSRQMELVTTASRRLSQALADLAEVLTPEQRAGLAKHIQNHRNHAG